MSAWLLLSPVNVRISASRYVQNIPGSQFSDYFPYLLNSVQSRSQHPQQTAAERSVLAGLGTCIPPGGKQSSAPLLVNQFQGTSLSTASRLSTLAFLEWPLAIFSQSQHSPGCNPNRRELPSETENSHEHIQFLDMNIVICARNLHPILLNSRRNH